MASINFQRVLLTGASGALGTVLRQQLPPYLSALRLSDIKPLPDLNTPAPKASEDFHLVDLANKQAVIQLVEGCDAIVHFGGKAVEGTFEEVLEANIKGTYHIYEAARIHGAKRVVFASSNHAIGFHPVSAKIDGNCAQRPDSNYGVSKAYGEDLGRFYFDRYGIESVCLRIGSSFPKPLDRRMLVTWLSYRDLVELVRCSLACPRVDHTIVYGVSDNKGKWWDNSTAGHLGFHPQDNTEAWRAEIEAAPYLPSDDPAVRFQGGGYVKMGPWK
jgi:uronate dehydrogenase